MRTVHKVTLRKDEQYQIFDMPRCAKMLSCAMQRNEIVMWYEFFTTEPAISRRFGIFGTGWQMPAGLDYVGTVQDGIFVWHIYEVVDAVTGAVGAASDASGGTDDKGA